MKFTSSRSKTPDFLYGFKDGHEVMVPFDALDTAEGNASIEAVLAGGAGAVASVNGQTGVVTIDKAGVGLGNVDNTSDANKPVSTATAAALSGKADTVHSHNVVAGITVSGTPSPGQVLKATSGTAASWAAEDAGAVASVNGQTGVVTIDKAGVGLGNVDNTSDANKPVSTATQTALNAKLEASQMKTVAGQNLVGAGDINPTTAATVLAAIQAMTAPQAEATLVALETSADTTYRVPAPTGNAAVDTANVIAAFAYPVSTLIFSDPGTYSLNAQITWPTGKRLKSRLPPGLVVLKAADTATNGWMFVSSNNVADIGAFGITFDANSTARVAGGYSGDGGILDFGFGSATRSRWKDCEFRDTRLECCSFIGSDHRFTRCKWDKAQRSQVILNYVDTATFDRCVFRDYNITAGNPTYPALSVRSNGTNTPCVNLSVDRSEFRSLTSNGFAIEGVADGTQILHQMTVTKSLFDSNGVGGGGISGSFSESIINANRFINGTFSHRSGIEITGHGNIITSNRLICTTDTGISAPIIYVTRHYDIPLCRGNVVANNTLKITSATRTSIQGIGVDHHEHVNICDNTIITDLTGSATMNSAIYIGNATGPVRNCKVSGNNISGNSGTAGAGIRLLTDVGAGPSAGIDYGRDIDVMDNLVAGFVYGILLPSTANDTYITMVNNNLRQNTVQIQGTATGTGNTISSVFPR